MHFILTIVTMAVSLAVCEISTNFAIQYPVYDNKTTNKARWKNTKKTEPILQYFLKTDTEDVTVYIKLSTISISHILYTVSVTYITLMCINLDIVCSNINNKNRHKNILKSNRSTDQAHQ